MPTNMPTQAITRTDGSSTPTVYGWLRRPELDDENYDAWEKPDGSLYHSQVGRIPYLKSF